VLTRGEVGDLSRQVSELTDDVRALMSRSGKPAGGKAKRGSSKRRASAKAGAAKRKVKRAAATVKRVAPQRTRKSKK
jgi:hypothetical protein